MKKLFFLYVWLNLTRIAELRKEDLVKHIRKITIQTGRLFFSSSLTTEFVKEPKNLNMLFNHTQYFLRYRVLRLLWCLECRP